MLQELLLDGTRGGIRLGEIVAVDLERDAGGSAHHSTAFRDGGLADFRIAAQHGAHVVGDVAGGTLALALGAYVHVDGDDVRAAAAHRAEDVVRVGLAVGYVADGDFRHFRHKVGVYVVRQLGGHPLGRSDRQGDADGDAVGIRLREVFGLDAGGEEDDHCRQDAE